MNTVISPALSFKGVIKKPDSEDVKTPTRLDKQVIDAWTSKLNSPDVEKDIFLCSDAGSKQHLLKAGPVSIQAYSKDCYATLNIKNDSDQSEYTMTYTSRGGLNSEVSGENARPLRELCEKVVELKTKLMKQMVDVTDFLPPAK